MLQRLAPRDERRQQEIAERLVVEQQPPELLPVDCDVPRGLRHDGGQERALSRQQAQLAEEVRGSLAHDLVAGAIEQRDLPLEDRDERVALVAGLEQDVALVGGGPLAKLTHLCELRGRGRGAVGGPDWAWWAHPVRCCDARSGKR